MLKKLKNKIRKMGLRKISKTINKLMICTIAGLLLTFVMLIINEYIGTTIEIVTIFNGIWLHNKISLVIRISFFILCIKIGFFD